VQRNIRGYAPLYNDQRTFGQVLVESRKRKRIPRTFLERLASDRKRKGGKAKYVLKKTEKGVLEG